MRVSNIILKTLIWVVTAVLLVMVGLVIADTRGWLARPRPRVTLVSDVAGYQLKKAPEFKQFLQFLDDIGFWNPDSVLSRQGDRKLTATRLTVILTDQPQPGDLAIPRVNGNDKVLTSFGYSQVDGDYTLFIHVNRDAARLVSADADEVFNRELMRAVYLLVHQDRLGSDDSFAIAAEAVRDNYSKPFITIIPAPPENFFTTFKQLLLSRISVKPAHAVGYISVAYRRS